MDDTSLDIQLSLRHEVSRAKWHRELFRESPPPFLGALISRKEAAEALGRSISYVRNRMEDGRLNTWKDPVSKQVWILKDDVDILIGDNAALQEQRQTRRQGARAPIHNPNSTIRNRKTSTPSEAG